MTSKLLCILLLTVVAAGVALGQNEDIPVGNENQYPPDNRAESDQGLLEGSGDMPSEVATTTDEPTPKPQLEDIQSSVLTSAILSEPTGELSCPKPCVCHLEGGSANFVVDCSDYNLTEFPSPLDVKTTILNLQNNKLTEIPKDIASLINLKELNAGNNLIMDLASGSVSELTQLKVLKLANNRLIEYPKDLKNSFSLTNLEVLDLGGNDMRTSLKPETFSNFKSLQILILPKSIPNLQSGLIVDLCQSLHNTLNSVCSETCTAESECSETDNPVLPGLLSADNTRDNVESTPKDPVASSEATPVGTNVLSSRTGIKNDKDTEGNVPAQLNSPLETSTDKKTLKEDIKVGATTTDAKTGGVDKSVIGIIVAAMVVVVAAIVIKKNWSSIRRRFSSSSRTPQERGGANANGMAPEEVPLQDKSPA